MSEYANAHANAVAIVLNGGPYQTLEPPHTVDGCATINERVYIIRESEIIALVGHVAPSLIDQVRNAVVRSPQVQQEIETLKELLVSQVAHWLDQKALYFAQNKHLGPYSRDLATALRDGSWIHDLEDA